MRPRAAVSWRRRFAAEQGDQPDAIEVLPDHFFGDPAALEALAERFPIVVHDTGTSPGTPGPLDPARLRRVLDVVRRSRASRFTEHLAATRTPSGLDLGHLFPIPLTPAFLAGVIGRVKALQDALGVPIALENPAAAFVYEGDPDVGTALGAVVDATGCGVLLDVENLVADAHNGLGDAVARLDRFPLHAVVQVHLAGGRRDPDGTYVDSHDSDVSDTTYAVLAALVGRAPVDTVVIERDARVPSLARLVGEARRAANLWGAS